MSRVGKKPIELTKDQSAEVKGRSVTIKGKKGSLLQAIGHGLWAFIRTYFLRAGFLDGRERVLQGAIRELREETGFALLDATLEEALVGTAVFDHPDRSSRGRTITHAHFFDLKNARPPQVAGADDAAEACWVPIAALAAMEGELFEDHFNILNHFLDLVQ